MYWMNVKISKNQSINFFFPLLVLCSRSFCPNLLRRLLPQGDYLTVDWKVAEGEVTKCGRCRRRCSVPLTPLSELGDANADWWGVTTERRTLTSHSLEPLLSHPVMLSMHCGPGTSLKHHGSLYRWDCLPMKPPLSLSFISQLAVHEGT